MVHYSVVVPIKNEEENIEDLFQEIAPVMKGLAKEWELIFIDDGSDDSSQTVIKNLCTQHSEVKLLSFDQNYGQSSAFDAGFRSAKGEFVITMDGDRQNDPADIPKLTRAMGEADLACGWRKDRRDPWLKRISSSIANGIRGYVCQDYMHDTGCSLKVYRKQCLERIKLYHGMHRFLPALFKIEGYRVVEIPVNHRNREKGTSKYGLFNRLIGPLLDMFAVSWMRKRHLRYKIREQR